MKFATTAFKAALAASQTTFTTCWLTIKTDGSVQGFTALDRDVTFNLEAFLTANSLHIPARVVSSGSQVYKADVGYKRTDVASASDLSVDNLEMHGPMTAPAIVLADVLAGIWDFCYVVYFMVNYSDLTQGALILRCGTVGEITTERDAFKAEARGLSQALTRQLGELTSPMCRANLGDARCKVVLSPTFTVTGTIEAVNDDDVTLYDSSRTEPGPTGGIAITNVSNANPGVVTMTDDSLALIDNETVTIAGVLGPALVNMVLQVQNPSGNTFDLPFDTSDTGVFPPYTSGGVVTPLGSGTSGYFTNGVITFTSGANDGLSMEIKSYDVGVWTLYLPMPNTVAPGDTYSMVAGCDKTLQTCKDKFSNVVNFRGEPYLPGMDKIVQFPQRS